jgi:hypothetical protein
MEAASKEELADSLPDARRLRAARRGHFWFGADFPGGHLEYVVIVRCPTASPTATTTRSARASARASSGGASTAAGPRQVPPGIRRLMRLESDRGCVSCSTAGARAQAPRLPPRAADRADGDALAEDGGGPVSSAATRALPARSDGAHGRRALRPGARRREG